MSDSQYADSAETDPRPVAGIAGFAEDKQGGNKKHVEDKQPLPLVGNDINIDNRKYKKQNNTKNQRKRLDKNIAAARVSRCTGDKDNPINCGYHAER